MGTVPPFYAGDTAISTQSDQKELTYPKRSGWAWVPSLYFAQGIPYVIVTMVSAALYKRLGVSNADIGWYTSLLGLPWVIKPLWGPLVDLYWTKRKWTLSTQLLMAIGLITTAFLLPTNLWWIGSLTVFTMMAFASATHDIAADGFYMLGLDPHRQALFNGIRSTFWRLSMIIGTGVLVILAGVLESHSGPKPVVFGVDAGPAAREIVLEAPAPQADEFVIIEPRTMRLDAGTTAELTLRLAKAPEPDTTVALSVSPKHEKWYEFFVPVGDTLNVKVLNADRVEIPADKWAEGAKLVVSVDKNLKKPVMARFNVAAGDIPWAWGICIGVVAGVFTLLFLWHTVALPKPDHDRQTATGRPPFVQAAFWLILAVGTPLAVLWGGYELVKPSFADILLDAELAKRTSSVLLDLNSFGIWAVLCLAAWGILLFRERDRTKVSLQFAVLRSLVTVGVVGLVLWVACTVVSPLMVSFLEKKASTLDPDKYQKTLTNMKSLIGFGVWGVLGFVAWSLLRIPQLGGVAATGFRTAARRSGIPFDEVFASFFRKPGILRMIAFLMMYRLAETLLVKMIAPFMLDPHEAGGLGLSTTQYGLAYGTIGVFGLLLGGIAGSVYVATVGLLRARLVMCLFVNVPIALFVMLAFFQPSFLVIIGSVFIDQFGYGFGFAMYMLYMLYIAGQGENKASHYAICTGFMALSFMLPGMVSGILQEFLGYKMYFLTTFALASLSLVSIYIIPIDPEFGRKKKEA